MQALHGMQQAGLVLQRVLQFDEQPMPVALKRLIELCVQPDPAKRPTAARLAAALKHIRDVETSAAAAE